MPPTTQSSGRRPDDGGAPQLNRKISRDSAGSKISPDLHNEVPVKNDAQEGVLFSPSFRAATNGGIKRSILRKSQVDAWQDMSAGLPAEKGFPIQIGSELFRLSGASIMSDGQFTVMENLFAIILRVLEHPHIFPNSSRISCVRMKKAAVCEHYI